MLAQKITQILVAALVLVDLTQRAGRQLRAVAVAQRVTETLAAMVDLLPAVVDSVVVAVALALSGQILLEMLLAMVVMVLLHPFLAHQLLMLEVAVVVAIVAVAE